MYILTLEINQICNFNCRYCYLGEKNGAVMPESVAYAGVDIALVNAQKHPDKRLWVDFVGGEALLTFELLTKIVKYIEQNANAIGVIVNYSLTTNGSIMNKEILQFLKDKKVHIKLSIDGDEVIHNRNRKLISGKGSYKLIEKNLATFRLYEKSTHINVQAAHVITKNNYDDIFHSVKYLVDDLGFKVIDSSIDITEPWMREQVVRVSNEWERIIKYFVARYEQKKPFLWGPILDMMKYTDNQTVSYCGVGLVRIYVRTDGNIYGCAANLNHSGWLGHTNTGLSLIKIENLRKIQHEKILCKECYLNEKCQTKKCVMNNMEHRGEIDKSDHTNCYFEKEKYKLWLKYENRIKNVFKNTI